MKKYILLLLAGLLSFYSCDLLESTSETSDANFSILITNNIGADITLAVGNYNDIANNPLGEFSAKISASTTDMVFKLNSDTDYNIWYVNDVTLERTVLYRNGSIGVFNFSTDYDYLLYLEIGGNTLYEYLATPTEPTSPNEDIYSYKVLPATRGDANSSISDSMNAKNLNPITATVEKVEKSYGTTYIKVHGTFTYNGDSTEENNLSFPKTRFSLLDSAGNEIYSSLYGGSDGFDYMYSPTPSFYTTYDGEKRYGNYDVFKGENIYLTNSITISSDDTTHPLYNIDLNKIASIKFDPVATVYESLVQEKIPAGEGLEVVNSINNSNSIVNTTVTNESADTWYQVSSYRRKYYLLDSSSNIISSIDSNLQTGDYDLIEPLTATNYFGNIQSAYNSIVSDVIIMLHYEPGVPNRSLSEPLSPEEMKELADYNNSMFSK